MRGTITEFVGDAPNGHGVWRQTDTATGHVRYYSSEVDGTGVTVWDTLSDPSTVRWVLDQHS